MKKLFITFAFLLSIFTVRSQNIYWKFLNGTSLSRCISVVSEPDSGFTFFISRPYSMNRATIVRTDKYGTVLSSNNYAAGIQIMDNMIKTMDDGYVISARSFPISNDYTQQLIKLDNSYNPLWSKSYSYGSFNQGNVIETSDSGLAIYGKSDSTIYLVKTDPSGNIIWSKRYSNSINNIITSASECPDHGFIITGAYSTGIHYQSFLIKTDASGNILWQKIYDSVDPLYIEKTIPTPNGGYLTSGKIWDQTYRTILMKVDSLGGHSWSKIFSNAQAGKMKSDNDGNYFLYGITNLRDTSDIVLIKINPAGDILWNREYGLESFAGEYPADVIQTSDNGYMIAGYIYYYSFNGPIMLKTDSTGILPCNMHPISIADSQPAVTVSAATFTSIVGFNSISNADTMTTEQITDSLECDGFTGISEPVEYSWLTVYPSPAQNYITVSLQGPYELHNPKLLVYDGIGKLIKHISNESLTGGREIKIDIKDLSKGLYYILLVNDNRIAGIERVVKTDE